MKRSAEGIKLKAFDDLFETDESREDLARERIMEIPIDLIDDFPNHPYKVRDDENMSELVESIKEKGLINPVMVRPVENGRYEMIAGHRRKRACQIAGIEKIKARVTNVSRDDAVLLMVDSNLQREEILPSEKAFAYKMRYDVIKKRAGERTDLTRDPVGLRLKTSEIVANENDESATQVKRYIRLTELIPEILNLVDEKKIALRPAVEISYISEEKQYELLSAMELADATPSHAQSIKMRKFHNEGKLTQEVIESIMLEEKPNQREKPMFRDTRISGLIPKSIPLEKQSDYVCNALEYYNRYLRKKRECER